MREGPRREQVSPLPCPFGLPGPESRRTLQRKPRRRASRSKPTTPRQRTSRGRTPQDRAPVLFYTTAKGRYFVGKSEEVLELPELRRLRGKVNLVLTSPPFPLNRKKAYGNLTGSTYLHWLASLAERLHDLLSPTGSVVLELGNAWETGSPTFSTLPLKALLAFQEAGKFYLCQEFVCYNPAKLPTPAQWVTVERVRAKDAFTRVWWMSATARPQADNRRVLVPYSEDMRRLLKTKTYNAGVRPSEHVINATSFLVDNKGAIPSNVLVIANTRSSDPYLRFCKERRIDLHPARMPLDLARFFVKFLTKPGDLVVDPFAGSNVTGLAAEELDRRWIAVDSNPVYALGSAARFPNIRRAGLRSFRG
jgi:DNA modification methylase